MLAEGIQKREATHGFRVVPCFRVNRHDRVGQVVRHCRLRLLGGVFQSDLARLDDQAHRDGPMDQVVQVLLAFLKKLMKI